MLSPTKSTVPVVPPGVDEVFYALHLLRRRRLDDCIKLSAHLLSSSRVTSPSHPHARNAAAASSSSSAPTSEEQLWYAQTKALVMQNWYDDTELEEDGVDQVLMEGEQAVVSALHKPNTSLTAAAGTKTGARRTAGGGGVSRAAGLGTASARPMSSRYGFARPGSVAQRPGSASRGPGGTAGHHRPITGRLTRLGTASLQAIPGGPHIQLQRLDVGKYARTKPMVAKLLCDYLLYVEHQPKMAMELCRAARQPQPAAVAPTHPPAAAVMPSLTGPKSAASAMPSSPTTPAPTTTTTTPTAPALPPMMPTVQLQVGIHNEDDAWWRQRLGKSCYQLGLLREAEMHLKAALYDQPRHGRSFTNGGAATSASMEFANYDTSTIIELGKVYAKLDQPLTALDLYNAALRHNPIDHHVLLCCARLRDELHEPEEAFELYTQVLRLESSNVEAIACVAAYFLYGRNQPELSLRYYRRLLQMGMNTTEVWNNLGLCAFLTSQLDYALSCFERALNLCQQDAQRADVWYNIGHIGVGLGDHRFAQQAFRLAVAADATHAEATNNLAVLALGPTADDGDGSAEGRRLLQLALSAAPELVEALYNSAVVAYRAGELEEAFSTTNRVLDCAPEQAEAAVLHDRLQRVFAAL